jgi:hypothetical protein
MSELTSKEKVKIVSEVLDLFDTTPFMVDIFPRIDKVWEEFKFEPIKESQIKLDKYLKIVSAFDGDRETLVALLREATAEMKDFNEGELGGVLLDYAKALDTSIATVIELVTAALIKDFSREFLTIVKTRISHAEHDPKEGAVEDGAEW